MTHWQITREGQEVSIKGEALPGWKADLAVEHFGKSRLLVHGDGTKGLLPNSTAAMRCQSDHLLAVLQALHQKQWSGVVVIDPGFGVKRLYLVEGELVFAASSIIDDRLGEIIYRNGEISLDDLTESAAQVNRSRKFGQVLIESAIFSNYQLWEALRSQAIAILRTIFFAEDVYLEFKEGKHLAPTEVLFQQSSLELFEACDAYGSMFRGFLRSLTAKSRVVIKGLDEQKIKHKEQTFVGDFIRIIGKEATIDSLLQASKFLPLNTLAVLFELNLKGICSVEPLTLDPSQNANDWAFGVRKLIDSYHEMLKLLKAYFKEKDKIFPLDDLRGLVVNTQEYYGQVWNIDDDGFIEPRSLERLIVQSRGGGPRQRRVRSQLIGLNRFLLQIAGDHLTWEQRNELRQIYQDRII